MNIPPIVALEIGTHKVRVVIGEAREDGHMMITGVGECASRGVRKAEVVSIDNALACVRAALQAAEEQAQVDINDVHLVFSGGHLQSCVNRGQVPVMNEDGEITEDEIESVGHNARTISLPPEREVIHSIAQHYFVDDHRGVINPNGMLGSKLGLDMLLMHGVRNRIKNTVRVAGAAHVEVLDMAFSGLCSGLAVLSAEQKERGVLVIDFGAGTTDTVVYADKAIAYAGTLAVGGDHVTNDVAFGLNLSMAQAEKIKISHGHATLDLSKRNRTVSLAPESGFEGRAVKLMDLNTIINARMEETLTLIKNELGHRKVLHLLGAGVVLTGGGAHMRDIVTLVERELGVPCSIGTPREVGGLAYVSDGPEYAACIGMLKYGLRSMDKNASSFSLGTLVKSMFGR